MKFKILYLSIKTHHLKKLPSRLAFLHELHNWRDVYDVLGMVGLQDTSKSEKTRLVLLDKVKDVVETVRDQI